MKTLSIRCTSKQYVITYNQYFAKRHSIYFPKGQVLIVVANFGSSTKVYNRLIIEKRFDNCFFLLLIQFFILILVLCLYSSSILKIKKILLLLLLLFITTYVAAGELFFFFCRFLLFLLKK